MTSTETRGGHHGRHLEGHVGSLRTNVAWSLSGNLVSAAARWGMLVVLARLGGAEVVGRFALALSVCTPIFLLASFGIRPLQVTDARNDHDFGHYLALRLLGTPAAILLSMLIAVVAGYPTEVAWVIFWMATAKAFEATSDVFLGKFQKHEHMDWSAISSGARSVFGLACLAVVVDLSASLVWGMSALACSWALILLLYDVPRARQLVGDFKDLAPSWSLDSLLGLAQIAWPIAVVSMLNALTVHIPRYAIQRELGDGALGIFSALAYVLVAGNLVVSALGQSASPRLAKLYADSKRDALRALLFRLIGLVLGLGALGIVTSWAFGRTVLELLYGEGYGVHDVLLRWLALGFVASALASILGYAMTAMRTLRLQPVALACSSLVVLVCSVLWVADHGLEGAAWAYIVGMAVQFILIGFIVFRKLSKMSDTPTVQL